MKGGGAGEGGDNPAAATGVTWVSSAASPGSPGECAWGSSIPPRCANSRAAARVLQALSSPGVAGCREAGREDGEPSTS